MVEKICGGCTRCCIDFAISRTRWYQVEISHPGLIKYLGPSNLGSPDQRRNMVRVTCSAVIFQRGCKIHPTIIGREIRPSFCALPDPKTCGFGVIYRRKRRF